MTAKSRLVRTSITHALVPCRQNPSTPRLACFHVPAVASVSCRASNDNRGAQGPARIKRSVLLRLFLRSGIRHLVLRSLYSLVRSSSRGRCVCSPCSLFPVAPAPRLLARLRACGFRAGLVASSSVPDRIAFWIRRRCLTRCRCCWGPNEQTTLPKVRGESFACWRVLPQFCNRVMQMSLPGFQAA